MCDFERLGVCPEIIQAIEEDGWLLPTPVQDDAIPLILGGGDVCAAAETGSGKTGAFGIPCLQIVHEKLQNKALTSFNNYPAAGGASGGGVPPCLFDPNLKDTLVFVDSSGIQASCKEDVWSGVKTTGDVQFGKYMYEVEVLNTGLTRVGWASIASSLDLGKDARSFGFGGTGKKSWNKGFADYGEPFGLGDIIGCLIDREKQTLTFAKNGKPFEKAFDIPQALHSEPLKPSVCGKNFSVKLNTTSSMVYPVEGYKAIGLIDAKHTSVGISMKLEAGDKKTRKTICLILEPTRDLAQQTYDCMHGFAKYLTAPAIRLGLFVGGVDERAQHAALENGVDIAVGTLQKICFYARKRMLDISDVTLLVLDEADELMKNDTNRNILYLKNVASKSNRIRVQTLFFSATLHSAAVREAIDTVTSKATWVDLKGKPSIPETVHIVYYNVNPSLQQLPCKLPSEIPPTDLVHPNMPCSNSAGAEGLSQRIKVLKPQLAVAIADAFAMSPCLVFCRTNLDCDNFEKYLEKLSGGSKFKGKTETGKESPYSCVVLAGMRSQEERQQHLEHFKSGDVRFMVATDVAARGIDIKELPFLIMMTLPDDPDQFFHRVGRVGRADHVGLAVCLVANEREKVWFHANCTTKGVGCEKRHLVSEGGCCIWFDEPSYLNAIEKSVGSCLAVMDAKDFSVEGIISPIEKDANSKTKPPTSLSSNR